MSNDAPDPHDTPDSHDTPIVIKISPEVLLNKNKKTAIVKATCSAVCGLLNSHYGGILKLTSSKSLTPAMLDELVRGIEQTLIEHLGLTGLLEYCQTEITGLGKEIIFTVKPSDRVCTVEYNLVLPTDFLVKQVLRTEPLEKIARVLKPGRPLVNVHLQNHVLEFVKESIMPEDLREENSWKKVGICRVAEGEQSDSGLPKQDCISAACNSGSSSIPFAIPKVSPRNTKCRAFCRRITDYMEQLIQDGDFDKLQTFASKMCLKNKVFPEADIEVAVHFMLALGAYRRREFVEAYDKLDKASSLITATGNAGEFEVQRLHLLACFRRGEGEYDTSYEVTYGGLQEIEGMSPGWHTAWVLNDAGYLFSILAGEERNEDVRKSLEQQAISLYTKAIDHTSTIREKLNESDQGSVLKSNLLHRCHLRRAMLSLGCKPLAEEDDGNLKVTNEEIGVAISSILVVEESSLKGDSLTDVNECYLYLVKSDLNYRRSQFSDDHCEKYTKTARDWATKARDLAAKDQFCGIFKYAQSRIDLLTKAHCRSSVEEKLFADLDDYKKCQP
ncbi:Hypothetical predicted protein [Paramuricea clavata]|uniref:Uncharacterized protein n=1 Tax=Paramuricea clavata TaxID=317549 RepID=A0A7D9K3L4_PARCT|nr:Hypothetical predicted protein [Paramuricea clavata]